MPTHSVLDGDVRFVFEIFLRLIQKSGPVNKVHGTDHTAQVHESCLRESLR